ncbi:MAG TPA: hypothetical protein VFO60_07295, partial [Candidatus Dormibacteraeota bacterium]|nr:hypothetical protein [Candidatus Dormibacteraeota bacterium]
GAIVGLVLGVLYGVVLIESVDNLFAGNALVTGVALGAAGAVGLILGVVLGPSLTIDPYLWLERTLAGASSSELAGGGLGLIISLVVSALVAVPLFRLPDYLGLTASLALTAVLAYLGVTTGIRRRVEVVGILREVGANRPTAAGSVDAAPASPVGAPALLDTSVLIDARILDVARCGFLPGRLLIPGFVLEELQRVADSGDPMRRARGRRGLTTVEALQKLEDPRTEIVDVDFPGVPEVDSRLVRLARARGAAIMTTDYMLNRLASIEGLRVLNINDLVLALKPIVASGETLDVAIVKEGKELNQGVGYLEDGTMVVVENGRRHLDERVTATVTSVIQTPAGRMIFGQVPPSPHEPAGEEPVQQRPRRDRDRDPRRPMPRVVKS